MFERTKAVLGILINGGRVPVLSETTCHYCGKSHSNWNSLSSNSRPYLSAVGNPVCRGCGRRLDDGECSACGTDFIEQDGDGDGE